MSNDKNVSKVIDLMLARSRRGYDKYGTTTERKDLTLLEWLQHLQEELLDAAIYVVVLKGEVNNAED
jgi:hypothetical protein